ncbi:MAG: C4-type zinc ribbon domain-containing protein [Treponema sp.]|nr:MAG: C4-type zinc ribbon domain-containing protein [Treponema sp.]
MILGRKYELESKIDEAPKQLGSQDELLARMKKEYIEKNKEYEAVKERVGQLKIELDEAVKLREDGEKNMDNITTHREYEALDKQISEASAKEADVRKELQKEEKSYAELNDILKTNEAIINSTEESLNESKKALDSQLSSYKSEIAELKSQEEKIVPGLDQEILFKFQRIIQRNSEGIVAVKNGVCTGCHMILPGQFANEVREGENILFCPYCSRILFYEASTEGDQITYYNDTGSLADSDDELEDEFEDDEDSDSLEFSDDEETSLKMMTRIWMIMIQRLTNSGF